MNDSTALRRRLLRYVIPVLAFALLFNLTKFFESRVKEEEEEEEEVTGNSTQTRQGSGMVRQAVRVHRSYNKA